MTPLCETQKVKAVQRFIDPNVGGVWFHSSTFPAEAEPRTKMKIKWVTLEKCCENMPSRTCFGKPRSCCYGCLRVCGHGIMISPVKVKCELRSLELCESEIILPHSASSAAKTNRSPHLHTLGTIPAGEKWMLGWGFMFSQPCGTWAHLSSFAHSSTCVYAVQAAIRAH